MDMKLAHSAVVTPGRCGLYETTRELVVALRADGVDSRIVDPTRARNKLHPTADEDRGALFADAEWALQADVLVNHSGLGSELEATELPVIHVAHGRPRSSFLSEVRGSTPIYSYHYHKDKDPRFKCVVTFWPEHVDYLEVMWPETKVCCVSPPVDLARWTPDGPKGYRWHGHGGAVNIVCTDAWRVDVDPFPVVNAFALWAREHQGAKLHIYGNSKELRGWAPLIKQIQDDGNMGEVRGWVAGLAHVYRAATMLITPHMINVRSVREALACGCPVARMNGASLSGFGYEMGKTLGVGRSEARRTAEVNFNPQRTATSFARIAKDVVNGC